MMRTPVEIIEGDDAGRAGWIRAGLLTRRGRPEWAEAIICEQGE